jgi:hemoglobin
MAKNTGRIAEINLNPFPVHAIFFMRSRSHRTEPRILLNREIYSIVGAEAFRRLAAAFYNQLPEDDLIGPMYPQEDMEGAEERLREFLIFLFGGPQTYIQLRGLPRLGVRHARFAVDQAARERWMLLMNNAFAETALPPEVEQAMRKVFEQMSTSLINQVVSGDR